MSTSIDSQQAPPPTLARVLTRLAPYLRPRWAGLALAALGTIGATVVDLAKPWPLKLVFDTLLGGHAPPFGITLDPTTFLVIVGALIVLIALLDGLFSYWRVYSLKRAGQEVAFDLRAALFAHIQALSLGVHQRQRTGDTITRVTEDINVIEQFLTDSLLTMIASALIVAGMFAVMLSMDLVLGLAAFVLAPFLLLLIHRFTARIKHLSRWQRLEDGALASIAQEAISANQVVKAFTAEERLSERFREFGQRSLEAKLRVAHLEAQFGWAADIVAAVGTAAVVVIGTQRALAGAITPGDLVIFTTYLRRLYSPLKDLVREINKTQKAVVRAERVVAMLETDPGVKDEPGARPAPKLRGAIDFDRVWFAYGDGQPVLEDVRLHIEPGQTVALVGPTGAGKSTLAALVPRFYDVTAGRVLIDNVDVRGYTLRSLRSQIALVLQESVLFHATVADNIAYGNPTATASQIRAAARAAHADEFITALPQGYDTLLGERGATLSGGQRQRIAVARALVRDAPIVILDEPTTGLDAQTEALLLEALARLSIGRTTLVIAHSLSTIQSADLIVVLDRGRIVESGRHDALLARAGRYAELFGRQARAGAGGLPAPSR
jgi:ATP-binding cassette, subfamily B, bacterial